MSEQIVRVNHPHITTDKEICNGSPIIKGTRTPVRSIIGYANMGLTPEEILATLPYLKLSEIYDALSFYYDNKELIDKEIEENNDIEYLKSLIINNER